MRPLESHGLPVLNLVPLIVKMGGKYFGHLLRYRFDTPQATMPAVWPATLPPFRGNRVYLLLDCKARKEWLVHESLPTPRERSMLQQRSYDIESQVNRATGQHQQALLQRSDEKLYPM
jgi:hypothetical protein